MLSTIENSLTATCGLFEVMVKDVQFLDNIEEIAKIWLAALRNDKKIIFAGNGGSAADSQHLAAEMISRFCFDRKPLPALSLTVDTSAITAISNDYGYESVFSRQLEALGNVGDVLVVISTSGQSPNVLKALTVARELGLVCVGFTGNRKNAMNELCDYLVEIPHNDTARIQEGHIACGHAICEYVEASYFKEGG